MSRSRTEFDNYVEEQVRKIKGVYFPVKTNFLMRLLPKKFLKAGGALRNARRRLFPIFRQKTSPPRTWIASDQPLSR